MKRYLLILFLILSLLVSCTTKSVKTDESPVEFVEAAIVENTREEIVGTQTEQPETVFEEPAVTTDESVSETEAPVEDSTSEESVTENLTEETSEYIINPEEDWSYIFEQAPAQTTENISEETAEEVLETSAQDAEILASSDIITVSEAKKVPEPEKIENSANYVSNGTPDTPDKDSIIWKVGNFIVKEKLLSAGILTVVLGLLYLIIVLIKTTSFPGKKSGGFGHDETKTSDEQAVTTVKKKSDKHSDVSYSDDDEEFLRQLLESDNV